MWWAQEGIMQAHPEVDAVNAERPQREKVVDKHPALPHPSLDILHVSRPIIESMTMSAAYEIFAGLLQARPLSKPGRISAYRMAMVPRLAKVIWNLNYDDGRMYVAIYDPTNPRIHGGVYDWRTWSAYAHEWSRWMNDPRWGWHTTEQIRAWEEKYGPIQPYMEAE